ncbi:MAG: hypothetical protein CYPHOPRED_005530 [Cyphobasidiales sp. Tagirdzhanova-0007]|nr:MAG: hypothetical protein CYPHOPRED_005530 [Cyphobasidiales sp. Tagirdzhanova-0007]
MAAVVVSVNRIQHDERPLHHANASQSVLDLSGAFRNPWVSFDENWTVSYNDLFRSRFMFELIGIQQSQKPGLTKFYQVAATMWVKEPLPDKDKRPQVVKPDWGVDPKAGKDNAFARDIKATWLGHACFLVEFPSSEPKKRGLRVLFDPVFSHRCSPSQYFGPSRFTPPPLPAAELPEVDAVVLSHNHYDHTDVATLKSVYSKQNNGTWDHGTLQSPTVGDSSSLKVTCTPCQHFSGRSASDGNCSLWASWAVEQLPGTDKQAGCKVWFGGDTAYRAVGKGVAMEDEYQLPHCPAFKEIGEHFDGFDLAMIPIGAYSPRHIWSRVHASPEDAVEIHQDVRSRASVGMHWATWQLTAEDVNEPKIRLKGAVKAKAGMKENDFIALEAIGATLRITP